MSLLRKFKRHLPSKVAVNKILLGLTAFSLFAGNAHASEITDKDGKSLIDDNNVHDLYAQELDGNLARNIFDKFNLSENQIANLHFNQQGGDQYAFNLVNFVNHKVDVNGTVNAIRNGAVDGNLYFLSPEGIAVGTSGVINAGAFNAYSVDNSDFKSMRDGSMSNLQTQLSTNINNGLLTASDKAVEINGVINARNQIALRGQSVNVNQGAKLNAKSDIDFTTLVNAGSTVENISNLNMSVDPTGNGDIIISVRQEHIANDSLFSNLAGDALTVWRDNKTTSLNPTINMNGTIDATGNVSFDANANTEFKEGSIFNLVGSVKANFLNQIGIDIDADWINKNNNATINVGGNVNAGGDVSFNADASISARIISETPETRNSVVISNVIPTAAVVYAESNTNATINVKGTVDAKGNVNAVANANTDLTLIAKSETGESDSGNSSVIYLAVGIANADNKATVTFDKAVNAEGDFVANANNFYAVDNTVSTVTPDASFLANAIGINQGDNISAVNVGGNITAGGKIDVKADNSDVFSRLSVGNSIGQNQFTIGKINFNELLDTGSGGGITGTLLGAFGNYVGATSFIGAHSFDIMPGDGAINNLLKGDIFKAGVSVGGLGNNNAATVNIADGVKLIAGDTLNAEAVLTTKQLHSDVTNVLNNKSEGSSTKVGVGGAINVVDVGNNGSVIVGRNVELEGDTVTVSATSEAAYNQFDASIEYIKDAWSNFISTCKKFRADFSGGNDDVASAIEELGAIGD